MKNKYWHGKISKHILESAKKEHIQREASLTEVGKIPGLDNIAKYSAR